MFIEIFVIENNMNESVDMISEAEELIINITNILEDFGYIEIEKTKQSDSGTLYFTFCSEEDFNNEKVNLIIRMRVADHKLPL